MIRLRWKEESEGGGRAEGVRGWRDRGSERRICVT